MRARLKGDKFKEPPGMRAAFEKGVGRCSQGEQKQLAEQRSVTDLVMLYNPELFKSWKRGYDQWTRRECKVMAEFLVELAFGIFVGDD
jgi:hypothetical protein